MFQWLIRLQRRRRLKKTKVWCAECLNLPKDFKIEPGVAVPVCKEHGWLSDEAMKEWKRQWTDKLEKEWADYRGIPYPDGPKKAEGEMYNLAVSKEEKEAVDAYNLVGREIIKTQQKERDLENLLWQIRFHLYCLGKTDLTSRELGRKLELKLQHHLKEKK